MPIQGNGHHEGYFTSFDGLKLFYRIFLPASGFQELLLILHGHGEHSGRYEKFIENLKGEGLAFAVFDYRGHGRSEGKAMYIDSFDQYLEDVSAFAGLLKKECAAAKKLYLFGNSMGGLIALHWLLKHPAEADALFLSSPCLAIKASPILLVLNRFMNCIKPDIVYPRAVNPVHLTHDQDEVEKYKSDPFVRNRTTARLVREMEAAGKAILDRSSVELPVPVFILMAGSDKIVDSRKTIQFYEKIRASMKDLQIYSGFYHEIFNEIENNQPFTCLKNSLHKLSNQS